MSNNTTVYVPGTSAKARETNFGEVIRLSFKVDDLVPFLKENKNDRGYINFEITPRKETGKFGETHSVKLDTWEPKSDGNKGGASKPAAAKKTAAPKKQAASDSADDDIPF